MAISRKWFTADPTFIAPTATSTPIEARQGVLFGWWFKETTGAATAAVELVDGNSANGQTLVAVDLLANESTRDIWGHPGIWCDNGVFLRVLSGTVQAGVFYMPLTEDEIIELISYKGAL